MDTDTLVEYLSELVEKEIESYADFNEFVNKKDEFIEVFIYEFLDICSEEYGKYNDGEDLRVFEALKERVFDKVVRDFNCNFVEELFK